MFLHSHSVRCARFAFAFFFFFNDTATTEIYTLSLHDALPISPPALPGFNGNTGLSVTPWRPVHPSRASGCSSLSTPRGFPCCVRFPCVHAVATPPAQRLGASSAHFPSRISLPRYGSRVGPRIVL